ncbi:MAG: TIGR03936 family radical SAM-associated protein [Treponema sp.]|nr:TIGR03936 family radical SAM-associated protein [Treponema sp.]
MKKYVDPASDLGSLLLTVEKPGRYIGGEYGLMAKKNALLQTVIAFPDLYEIGMSNRALRIIYNNLNLIDDISCDRVFAAAPDFETVLRNNKLPIYGLETGINPGQADVLMFTLGYELGITNVLNILDLAGLAIRSSARQPADPIVIMGGPCVSNPLPYSEFIDFFWIGEAEDGFFDLMKEVRDLKKRGGDQTEIKKLFMSHPSIWSPGKTEAVRAVYSGFGTGNNEAAVYPVPVLKVIQHQGAVEIMRGCPNGCRFCHAGFWYRPMRQKDAACVQAEVSSFVNDGGYNEISLSSLSSGDYCGISDLIDNLNAQFSRQRVSFQLPSLKLSSFSLGILEKISEVRKSGLTFAVETPDELHQLSINKKASLEDAINIIKEARGKGWRGIKFYFMIGLPLSEEQTQTGESVQTEEQAIVEFLTKASAQTRMHFSINLGTFIPKPHTPYQWAGQISEETAKQKLQYIRDRLKPQGHKIGIQDPFVSVLEGIISRGGSDICALIEAAWQNGCRMDAWGEYLKKEIWEQIIKSNASLAEATLAQKAMDKPLPWNFIKSGIADNFLKKENSRSQSAEFTLPCIENCKHNCGVCNNRNKITENIIQANVNSAANSAAPASAALHKIIFSFTKEGRAIFYSHLDLLELFYMAFTRSGISVNYSSGFNPLPVFEIVSPLALGISSAGEIAAVEIPQAMDPCLFMEKLNKKLITGVTINTAQVFNIPVNQKKYSLSSQVWGSVYENINGGSDIIAFKDEKKYRQDKASLNIFNNNSYWGIKRLAVLAKDPRDPRAPKDPQKGISFFEAFGYLYPGRIIKPGN